jgi:hypothetical protein
VARSAPRRRWADQTVREYREQGFAGVSENDRRAEADNVFAGAEAVDEEGVQVFVGREADVEEEVVAAGEHKDRHDLGQTREVVLERVDAGAPKWADGDGDERLNGTPDRGQVDLCVVPAEHALPVQAAYAFEAGRCGDTQRLCFPHATESHETR